MTLIWMIIGGTALTMKIAFESLCLLIICGYTKQWELLFSVIATVVSTTTENMKRISIAIYIYRTVTNIIFMILISVWIFVDFECWRCTHYSDRQSSWIFTVFICVWIAVILSPVCLFWLVYFELFKSNVSSSRVLEQMIVSYNYDGILEMQLYAGNYGVYDKKNNKTLLMLAMSQNKPAVVSYLLNKNVNCDEEDSTGRNILDYCVQLDTNNNSGVLTQKAMKSLLTKMSKLNPDLKGKDYLTIFLLACYHGNLEMVESMINNDPNVLHDKTKQNINGLGLAMLNNRKNVVDFLQNKCNMKENLVSSYDAKTLDCVIASSTLAQTSVLFNIYQQKKRLKSSKGYTIFLCAVYHGNLECVKKLVTIDRNILYDILSDGSNAINVAMQNNHNEVESYLRKNHRVKARNKVKKILFLGSGGSGKSTIFKQLRGIYGTGFNNQERKVF
eukprot:476668_1